MSLGDILEIDDRTVLVLGQELDIDADQPDVANALLHRAGDTLFLIDTGVTTPFRAALKTAADRVGPWERLVVLSSFSRAVGVVPLPAPPKLVGDKVVSLFQPMHPFGATTRTYEERPLERITIGSARLTGWSFADGAVRVLRSQGHCAGHVIVHLRDSKILHLSDEGNGPCGVMHDADQLKLQTVLGVAAGMFDEGHAEVLTDGHSFAARRGAEATAYLDGLLDQAVALTEAALAITKTRESVRPSDFVDEYSRAVADLGVGGANPNPTFTGFMGINQLAEIGLGPQSSGPDAPWARSTLVDPAPVAGMPRGLALLPAAVAMLRWKMQKRHR